MNTILGELGKSPKFVEQIKSIETKIQLPELEKGEITDIAVVATSTMATNLKEKRTKSKEELEQYGERT